MLLWKIQYILRTFTLCLVHFFALQVQHCKWRRPRKLLMHVWKWSKDWLYFGRYASHPFIWVVCVTLWLTFHISQPTFVMLLTNEYQYLHQATVCSMESLCFRSAPQIGEVRDKPIVSYVGDSVTIICKMEDTKPKPSTWHWFKENGTEKVSGLLRERESFK